MAEAREGPGTGGGSEAERRRHCGIEHKRPNLDTKRTPPEPILPGCETTEPLLCTEKSGLNDAETYVRTSLSQAEQATVDYRDSWVDVWRGSEPRFEGFKGLRFESFAGLKCQDVMRCPRRESALSRRPRCGL